MLGSVECLPITLKDVVPLTLGINVQGEVMSTLIKKNSPTPCTATGTYVTVRDNQHTIAIRVLEGEIVESKHNHLLG